MRQTAGFSRRTKAGIIGAGGLAVACALLYFAEFRVRKVEILPEIRVERTVPEYPEPFLETKPAPEAVRDHLLDGDFKIVNQVQAIPEVWRSIFDLSFVEIDGSAAKRSRVELADPGRPIQVSDSVVHGLPFRRLIFAGFGAQRGFIYYQHGGEMPPSFCLAVMDGATKNVVWVGQSRKIARNLPDLRFMVSHGLFDDAGRRGC